MTAPATTTTESKAKSRRALLAGALGGLSAWAAGAVGRASPVRATHGGYLQFGHNHVTAAQTLIENSGSNMTVLRIENDSSVEGVAISARGTDMALEGFSASGNGVVGTSFSGYGVRAEVGSFGKSAVLGRATASTGILGYSGPEAFPAAKPKTGVYGHATQDAGSRGVWGRSSAGQGVRGQASSGVGLYGTASSGFALRTSGRLKADKVSGVATIPAGSTGVTVTPNVNVTGGSFVLLTPKANIGSRSLWFTTNSTVNTFRIRMGSSRSSNTKVAWLLLG
jgi:hypothetical protein